MVDVQDPMSHSTTRIWFIFDSHLPFFCLWKNDNFWLSSWFHEWINIRSIEWVNPITNFDRRLIVATLALSLWPRQGFARVRAKRETLSIWLSTTKSQKSVWFPCLWHIVGNFSTRAITLLQTSFQSEVCTQSYGPPKWGKPQLWDSHLGVPKQNDISMMVLWPGTKYTIRGKVVASPKSRLWWVLCVRVCPWFICAPKCSNCALTNLLFGFCRLVWVIEFLINLPSPILDL
jgi:hypothetical protein